MIKTASEYSDAKAFIDKELELYDYELSERMISEEVNLFFQDTEFYLDLLAEKLRVLEDLVDYLEFYSSTKIGNARNLVAEKEQVLKGLASMLSEQGAVSVPLVWDTNPLTANKDRDGRDMPTASVTASYSVTSSSILTHEQKPLAVTKNYDVQCFSDNIGSCIEDGYYITEYNLNRPKAVEELLEITIAAPDDFEFLDYTPINCSVEYVGKNHLNHILIKLKAKNMYKELENFNYDKLKDTNLNSVEVLVQNQERIKSVYNQEQDLLEQYSKTASEKYLDTVNVYWETNNITGNKKEVQNAAE